MKKLYLILCLFIAGMTLQATPIRGTFHIPGTPYATIAAAFADLNTNGVDSACLFLIDAGYAETALNLTLTVPTASSAFPVVFRKNPSQTGANPKIIVSAGSAANTDGGVIIAGTDYVTFEKLDIDASAQTTIEWGYALVKRQGVAPFDGCQHVTITNCVITLNKANTKATGIYSGNHTATSATALAITAVSDACNDCQFDNNQISNVIMAIALNGYSLAASPYTLYDHNNKMLNNTVTNFGGSSTASYGLFASYQDQTTINNNSVTSGTGINARLAGILLQNSVSSSGEVAGNTINVTSAATSQNTYGIWSLFGSTASLNTVSFHDNTVSCSNTTAGTAPLYGILNSGTPDTLKIYNNTFSNFSQTGTGTIWVIRHESSANNVFINGNTITGINSNSTGNLTLIYNQSAVVSNIYGNTLKTSFSNGGTVYGIFSSLGTTVNIFKNNIYDLSSLIGNTASAQVMGIYNSGTPNMNIYNNIISDLKANAATNNPSVCGLYLTGGLNNNAYYNTIFLNAASSGVTFGTAAVYAGITPTTILRNNILVNLSVPGAGGLSVVYRRSAVGTGTYSATSNNNDFYAGTPSPSNLIFFDGTTSCQTLAAYKTLVAPADAASFTEMPPFINSSTAPYNLKIQVGVNTLCESGGSTVSTPNITTDFEDQPRFPNAGYPDNPFHPATAPDCGADEFEGGINQPLLTFNVDMSTCPGFNPGTDLVYVAGGFPGAFWNEPGTNPNYMLTRVGTSLVYTLSLNIAPGTYEYKYFKNAGWGGGEWQGGSNRSVTVTNNTTQNDQWAGKIDWANLQWPGTGNINVGWDYNVYAQAFINNGVTGASGQTYGLQAWIGISTANTDPATWTNWLPAPYFGQSWDNDEFMLNIGPLITTSGTYYYASRFQFGNLPYVYGGFNGGFWNGTSNVSGVLTVALPAPAVFNVTGGGSYCQGGSGLSVGLSGSEAGVIYQLYKNAAPYGTPLTGTGSPLSFGIQTAGTYTLTGTNGGGTTNMNGNAVITESTPLPVSVTIAASINPVPAGSTVAITATPVNGGSAPSYQWFVNGLKAGTDSPVFNYTPVNHDTVTCSMVSSEICITGNPALSNLLILSVLPQNTGLQNITVISGQVVCYNAIQTITVAGSGSTFVVQNNGSATMIAGQNILYLPGTHVFSGGKMYGYIAQNNQYCLNPTPLVANTKEVEFNAETLAGSSVIVYPNPTPGKFTVMIGDLQSAKCQAQIFSMKGEILVSKELAGNGKYEFSLEGRPAGMYLVRILAGNQYESVRIIKE